ncbi:MAG: rod shape-determining protein MreC [Flavobacteriales bacterium]
MRNLWNLIAQYHVALLFIVLQGVALSWFVSSHGYPRGKWVKRTMEWQGAWNQTRSQWLRLGDLDQLNQELLAENASLRAELFALENGNNRTQIGSAEVIRSTWTQAANFFVLNKGLKDGIAVGQGVLQGSYAAGKIIEVSESFALGLPLVNQEIEWSARINAAGPVGRLKWGGHAIDRATLLDIPINAQFSPGDAVLTSGFQGYFPPGMVMGHVAEEPAEFDGQFLSVPVVLAADFRSIRYVEISNMEDRNDLDAMSSHLNQEAP